MPLLSRCTVDMIERYGKRDPEVLERRWFVHEEMRSMEMVTSERTGDHFKFLRVDNHTSCIMHHHRKASRESFYACLIGTVGVNKYTTGVPGLTDTIISAARCSEANIITK